MLYEEKRMEGQHACRSAEHVKGEKDADGDR